MTAPSPTLERADVPGTGTARRRARRPALAILVILELSWLAGQPHLHGSLRWAPIAIVALAHLGLVAVERRDPTLDQRHIVAAIVAVAVGAALLSPFGSRDFSIYAMYGRMATVHHLSPYAHTPAEAGPDPFLAQVAPAWHDDLTLYGPVFTAISAIGSVGFGSSPLLARLWFQGLAAGSLVVAARVLARRGVSNAVLILVGLSPVVVATVNGGHNDLLVGVLVLLGVDRATDGRADAAAVLLALACLVKVSALPVAAALLGSLALQRRWRVLARSSAVFLAVFVGGYALVGGARALEPLTTVGSRTSRASLWHALRQLELGPQAPVSTGVLAGLLALGALVIGTRLATGSGRHRIWCPAGLATAFGVLFCFSSAYVLPWYPAAYLPLSALCVDAFPRRVLTVGSLALLFAYVQPPGRPAMEVAFAPQAGVAAGVILGLAAIAVVLRPAMRAPAGFGAGEAPATLGR